MMVVVTDVRSHVFALTLPHECVGNYSSVCGVGVGVSVAGGVCGAGSADPTWIASFRWLN